MSDTSVIRIKPYHYIHVLDNNTNVTRVELGPQTFTRQEHEKIQSGPDPMIMIPPRNYCIISNPVVTDKDGKPVLDQHGSVKLKHGDEQIRFENDPFPLYPGEKLVGKVSPLQVVAPNAALRLRSIRDFTDEKTKDKHLAGDEWLFEGPGTYYPRVEVQVVEITRAALIKPNEALKLRARKACVDRNGNERKAGEEWLIRKSGSYLPGVDEEVVDQVKSYILTDKKALHLKATRTFTDTFNKERKAGEEWLVTSKEAETHIPDVYEQVVGEVKITTLTNRQYAVVLDPIGPNGKPQLGQKILRKGETSFFLLPGESLEKGIQEVQILGEEEALLLRAKEAFTSDKEKHQPGDRWMIYGPCDYVPPTQVEIVEKRKSIPLDENEGIYVRDIKSGEVKSILGAQSYLLKPNEELWPKELPKAVEELLLKERTEAEAVNAGEGRDKTRVVTYRAPHNSAVQIYDYKNKKSRVVFGPELVMLGPDEHFTVLSLSGDKPKRPHQIKSLALQLGPDFMTDVVIVETADHARLSLKLSYNWHFKVNKSSIEDATKIFQVPDFVGDSCKAIASRVRGTVASVSFDNFHKNSAKIIRMAVFNDLKEGDSGIPTPAQVGVVALSGKEGAAPAGKGSKQAAATDSAPASTSSSRNFFFHSNNLTITNIDIQSVEPVDQRTRDSLQKSVQLAIEITTKSQEAAARHEAERMEQGARGRLERQKINDEAEAENARRELLSLQALSATVASTGEATAEAKARAESANIEGEAAVKQAQLKAEATKIKSESELSTQKLTQEAEIAHQKSLNDLELNKARELATIEAQKFNALVKAIGTETIKNIAQAGPEMQSKLLNGLGLKSFMITDGKSPINLFSTANGLIAPMNPAGAH